jgi:hypothetical protein
MRTRWTLLAMASACLGAAACGDGAAEEETVPIYWTAPDGKGGTMLKEAQITLRQAAELRARRAVARASAAGHGGVVTGADVGPRQLAGTISSQDWNDCQFLEWLLLTSQPNGSGSIFCAKGFGSPSNDGVVIPFPPRAYDPSNVWEGLICTSPTGCYVLKECGALGPATWRWVVPGSAGGEIPATGHALDFLIMNPPDGGPC